MKRLMMAYLQQPLALFGLVMCLCFCVMVVSCTYHFSVQMIRELDSKGVSK